MIILYHGLPALTSNRLLLYERHNFIYRWVYYIIKTIVFQVKYSAHAECEIIHFVNCEISHFVRCEMKFAHIRVSEYFTFAEQIFHSEAPLAYTPKDFHIARKGKCRWKKHTSVSRQMCAFFWWRQLDSNQWPLACQASTLTNWAMLPYSYIIHTTRLVVKDILYHLS